MTQFVDARLSARLPEALIDDEELLLDNLRTTLQQFVEAEMTESLNAVPRERTYTSWGHLNWYKLQKLTTRVGWLELPARQDQEHTFSTQKFDRYQRSATAQVLALMDKVIKKVSTRKARMSSSGCAARVSARARYRGYRQNSMRTSRRGGNDRWRRRTATWCWMLATSTSTSTDVSPVGAG